MISTSGVTSANSTGTSCDCGRAGGLNPAVKLRIASRRARGRREAGQRAARSRGATGSHRTNCAAWRTPGMGPARKCVRRAKSKDFVQSNALRLSVSRGREGRAAQKAKTRHRRRNNVQSPRLSGRWAPTEQTAREKRGDVEASISDAAVAVGLRLRRGPGKSRWLALDTRVSMQ
jgi:hypothetical protein